MEKYKSLEELYMDNYKLIFAFLFDYTNHQQTAEDLASIVWSKVVGNPDKFLDMDKAWLRNYLRKVAKHAAIDYFNGEKKRQERESELKEVLELISSPEDEFLLKEQLAYLEQAKAVLNESELELVCQRFIAELSISDIAVALGITAGAVRVKQHRIFKKLKVEIERLMNVK